MGENVSFRDKELHDNLKQYFSSVVDIIKGLEGSESSNREEVIKSDREVYARRHKDGGRYPSKEMILQRLDGAWDRFPGFESCKQAFMDSELYIQELQRAKENDYIEEDQDHLTKETLPKLLNIYLRRAESDKFDEKVFNSIYQDYEDYLNSSDVTYVSLTFLRNFQMDREEVEIEENLKVKEIDEQIRQEFSHNQRRMAVEAEKADYVIEKKFKVPKYSDEKLEAEKNIFSDLMLVMSLYPEKGDVMHHRVFTKSKSKFFRDETQFSGEARGKFYGEDFHLSNPDEFLEFWDVMQSQISDPAESYRIALDKFSNSFQRNNENDRLLDNVIALEALYLKSGEFQEMSYRLSQRGALMLSGNEGDALELRDTLKDAYKNRSHIVHGSQINVDKDFIETIHEITRESLVKFLKENNEGKDHGDILDELDDKGSIDPQTVQ